MNKLTNKYLIIEKNTFDVKPNEKNGNKSTTLYQVSIQSLNEKDSLTRYIYQIYLRLEIYNDIEISKKYYFTFSPSGKYISHSS